MCLSIQCFGVDDLKTVGLLLFRGCRCFWAVGVEGLEGIGLRAWGKRDCLIVGCVGAGPQSLAALATSDLMLGGVRGHSVH